MVVNTKPIVFFYWMNCWLHLHCRVMWVITTQFLNPQLFYLSSVYSIGFFTNTQRWQYWHYCQFCIPIHLQFPSLFAPYNFSKCEIRCQWSIRVLYFKTSAHWSGSFWMAQLRRSCQYWHSGIADSLWKTLLMHRTLSSVNVVDLVKTLWSVSSIHKRCDYF